MGRGHGATALIEDDSARPDRFSVTVPCARVPRTLSTRTTATASCPSSTVISMSGDIGRPRDRALRRTASPSMERTSASTRRGLCCGTSACAVVRAMMRLQAHADTGSLTASLAADAVPCVHLLGFASAASQTCHRRRALVHRRIPCLLARAPFRQHAGLRAAGGWCGPGRRDLARRRSLAVHRRLQCGSCDQAQASS